MSKDLSPTPPKQKKWTFGLSDLLPASLVLDLRQFLRSPIYLVLLALGLAYLYKTILLDEVNGLDTLVYTHLALLILLVPFRAGQTIARDRRERGSNFLQLCPLSAGRIIWGQFLSATFQMLAMTLALAPLYYLQMRGLAAAFDGVWSPIDRFVLVAPENIYLVLGLILTAGMAGCALMMLLAGLPLIFRMALQVAAIVQMLSAAVMSYYQTRLVSEGLGAYIEGGYAIDWQLSIAGMVMLLWASAMLLILASRHYSSQVEASSGRLRILGGMGLIALLLWLQLVMVPLHAPIVQGILAGGFFLPFLAFAMIDELMPNELRGGISPRRRGFLGYLTRRTTGANLIFVILLALLDIAGSWWICGSRAELGEGDLLSQLMRVATPVLALIYSALAALVVTDIFLPRASQFRLVAYGLALLSLALLGELSEATEYLPIHCCYEAIQNIKLETMTGPFLSMAACCLGSMILLALVHTLRGKR